MAWRTHRSAEIRRELRHQVSALQLAGVIRGRVEVYVALLRSTASRLREPESRTRAAFHEFIQNLQLQEEYPGIQGIGFARRVEADGVTALQHEMRAGAWPEFEVWPELEHPIGFPIVFLEPEDRRNLAAMGYDMYSEPVRHAAMARAARTGEPSASGRVTLVQEIDENKQAGFLIYVPVYGGAPPAFPDEPRDDLLGFAYSPFRAADLFHGMFGEQEVQGIRFAVYDGAPSPETLLHTSLPGWSALEAPVHRHHLQVAGRDWTLLIETEETLDHSLYTGLWFGVGGLVVTLLLSLLVHGLERNRAETERHAIELRASEQVARDNHNRKQAIFEAALDGIVTIDERALILEINQAAEQMLGRTRQEVIGQSFVTVVFPERFHERYLAGAEEHLPAGASGVLGRRLELVGRRADGTEFPIEFSLSRVEIGGAAVYTAFIRDITDRIDAQTRITELNETLERRVLARTAELEDANRQLESFSYSVSHDMRAPARHVLGYAELLKKRLLNCDDPEAQRLARVITEAAGRMAQLIDDLLAFSRTSRQELRRQSVSMAALVQETIRGLAPEIGARTIEWKIGDLPTVEGDRSLLALVWTNLLSNAVKYTRPREHAVVRIHADESPGETTFHVEDNGTGFDMRYVGKLFGVFSRLHRDEEFEGTGIGLANVARIIHRHGGRVTAKGELGVGATFSFSLPNRSTAESAGGKTKRPTGNPQR